MDGAAQSEVYTLILILFYVKKKRIGVSLIKISNKNICNLFVQLNTRNICSIQDVWFVNLYSRYITTEKGKRNDHLHHD